MKFLSERAIAKRDPETVRDAIMTAPHGFALYLDLDGTLLDIADRPESVIVEEGLAETLDRLRASLAGALAIVSGRALADVDRVLQPMQFDAAAEHGSTIRRADGECADIADALDPRVADAVEAAVEDLSSATPGVTVERKRSAIAVHYRGAPDCADRLLEALRAVVAESEADLRLVVGRSVFELAPTRASKARAVEILSSSFPFAGRRPIFIGDDVSDEEACVFVEAAGGAGLAVAGEYFAPDRAAFGSPGEVRGWISALSRELAGGGRERRP
jgi:trehalose 6-phosphate phosphatase